MNHTILPADLPDALDRAGPATAILSLDCFDTLLWRDCHAPTDVFAALGGVTYGQRIAGQANARAAARTLKQRGEVSLAEIYEQVMPGGSPDAIREAVDDELDAEAQTCFAFAPTVDLMRRARARGMRIVVVSDTFLTSAQLGRLIERVAGAEVAGMIERIFASCEVGIAKAEGLLGHVVAALKCSPREILHIGDNRNADFEGARAIGIPALHLDQFSDGVRRRLRLERACADLLDLGGEGVEGLQPHRAILACGETAIDDPARNLGYAALGPVFYAFDRWLREEADALRQARGGEIHWLFMLRDAQLPWLVHRAGGAAASAARVGLSRVVGIGASLASRETYRRHVALHSGMEPARFARQMLFTEEEVDAVVGAPETDAEILAAREALVAELRTGRREKITRRRARALGERLVAHVRAACDPQPGDTLMLVDLGYDGSIQNAIDGLLAEAFDCHVAGRYMLLREMTVTGLDKRGLIDARRFGSVLMRGLTGNSALIEQLSTIEQGSVIDYTDSGDPVHKASPVDPRQSAMREAVQAGCVEFARAAAAPPVLRTSMPPHAARAWRDGALAALTRFMFLPLTGELEVIARFEHDFNFGSEQMVALFDNDQARQGLRRRGLFYMKGVERMFLPAELAGEPIEARLSLLVQSVRKLGLTYADSMGRPLELDAIHFDARDATTRRIEAHTTYDGFRVVRLPLGPGGGGIALRLGAVFELVEIDSITRSPIASLKGRTASPPLPVEPIFDGMEEIAPAILACRSPQASLVIPPSDAADAEGAEPCQGGEMIEIVLRPLRMRGEAVRSVAGGAAALPAGPAGSGAPGDGLAVTAA